MENKKKNKIIIGIVCIIIIIVIIILGINFAGSKNTDDDTFLSNDTADITYSDQEIKRSLTSSNVPDVLYDSTNEKNVAFNVATLDGEIAYSLDYGIAVPSSEMKFRGDYLSDKGMVILMNGYPNKTSGELGCSTDDEAYIATQMALWEVTKKTGESKKSTETFMVKDATALSENDESYNRIVTAAEQLVQLAESEEYPNVPTILIDKSNIESKKFGEGTLIGPYTVSASGIMDSNIEIKASLVNAPTGVQITDEGGNEKDTLADGDTVYVKIPDSANTTSFNIKFETYVNRMAGIIYEESGKSTQDYVKLDLVANTMVKELTIEP